MVPKIMRNTIGVVCVSLILGSCGSPNEKASSSQAEDATPKKAIVVPTFNEVNAYDYVQKQVEFGPRNPGSKGHTACGDYLEETLKSLGASVFTQKGEIKTHDRKTFELRNIIGSFYPEKKKRIMLCAHWDTRPRADQDTERINEPILGANDGGSGVGVLLEIARILQENEPEVGVDIVLFDLEDYGISEVNNSFCLGSQYWARNPPVKGYRPMYAILFDMVGGPNALFPIEQNSNLIAPHVVKKFWDAAHSMGFSSYFPYQEGAGIADDHYYIANMANIPAIDVIEQDQSSKSGVFNKHWHTHKDNMDNVSKPTLKAVGQSALKVIYNEK